MGHPTPTHIADNAIIFELLCFNRSKRINPKLRSSNSLNLGLTIEISLKAFIDRKEQKTLVSAIILAVLVASGAINASSPKHVPASRPET